MATNLTKLEQERIKVLHAAGHSPLDISKKLGRSHGTIGRYIKDNYAEVSEVKEAFNENISEEDEFDFLVKHSMKRLKEMVQSLTLKPLDAVKILQVAFDKRQILQGKPTQIGEQTVFSEERQRQVDEIIAAFGELAIGSPKSNQETTGSNVSSNLRSHIPTPSSHSKNK